MSEPTKKRMLDLIRFWQISCAGGLTKNDYCIKSPHHCTKKEKIECQKILKAIRRLIENQGQSQPKVDEEVFDEWVFRLAHYAFGLTVKEARIELKTICKEAGVRIKEKEK